MEYPSLRAITHFLCSCCQNHVLKLFKMRTALLNTQQGLAAEKHHIRSIYLVSFPQIEFKHGSEHILYSLNYISFYLLAVEILLI